jgi:hypothetical protein
MRTDEQQDEIGLEWNGMMMNENDANLIRIRMRGMGAGSGG